MRLIHVAKNPPEAHLVKSVLEANGIEAVIRNEELFGALGGLPGVPIDPEVWIIDESREAEARRLLRHEKDGADEGE